MESTKVRYWNGSTMVDLNKITPLALSIDNQGGVFIPFMKDGDLMFFTGLIDSEGTDVFKSDLVEWDGEIWEVCWEHRFYAYSFCNSSGRVMLFDVATVYEDDRCLDIKVVGNKHEHPDLLT